jgi:hypothetical protein
MIIDFSTYTSIQTNLFIKIDIPDYDVLYFSDYYKSYTIGSDTYDGLGQLLSVSQTVSNLRAAPNELTIAISGIPAANSQDIINNRIKGSEVTVLRGFFNPTTGGLLSIGGNPAGKFRGIVSNYEISDDLPMGERTGTVVLTLMITSVVELLNNKMSGRQTNPSDQKLYYPTDLSMDRVAALAKSNFNFGAPG